MRVSSYLAVERPCRRDDRPHLIVHHLLVEAARHVGQDAAGRSDLDDIGARADLFANRASAVVGAIADIAGIGGGRGTVAVAAVTRITMAARHRDHPGSGYDRRAG
jgi:hypothetical protein